jgi:hypothetical protein
MKRIWMRIGARAGPLHDKAPPTQVPKPGEWDEDRGQFISGNNKEVVWRRGRWEKRHDKVEKKETIDFWHYGPGYHDYECTKVAFPGEEFTGCE